MVRDTLPEYPWFNPFSQVFKINESKLWQVELWWVLWKSMCLHWDFPTPGILAWGLIHGEIIDTAVLWVVHGCFLQEAQAVCQVLCCRAGSQWMVVMR